MRLKQNKLYNGLIGCVVFLSLFSCNSTRHLGDDEYLYSGAKLVFEGDSLSKAKKSAMNEELSSLMRPVPNASIFGFHSKLFFYNLAGDPEKSNKLRRWMRDKMGEPPVLFDQVDVDKNTAILSNRLENQGYFNVNVSHDTLIPGDKKKGIQYTIKPGDQYRICLLYTSRCV